jgi:hypothetical protein
VTTDIKPASDSDVADLKRRAAAPTPHAPNGVGLHNYHVMAGPYVARIDADRAKIAALETTQEELVKALEDAKGFLTTLRRSRENEEGAVDWALSDLNKALARAKQAAEQGKGESNG